MTHKRDMIGFRRHRLVVVSEAPQRGRVRYFNCLCDCGSQRIICMPSLVSKTSELKSCGCWKIEVQRARRTTHGQNSATFRTRTYNTWAKMIARCTNPNQAGWEHYGGRGITVCNEWRRFEAFFADMGERPEGKSLDRIDVNGNYEKSNCRWATQSEQMSNTRHNRWITYQGEAYTLSALARKFGLGTKTLEGRLNRGWAIERAVMPV